jgi:calmodulin
LFVNLELKQCFDLFDADGSGSISSCELKKALEALGIKATDSEVRILMKSMDADNSGCIDFDEFTNVMADHFYHKPSLVLIHSYITVS